MRGGELSTLNKNAKTQYYLDLNSLLQGTGKKVIKNMTSAKHGLK